MLYRLQEVFASLQGFMSEHILRKGDTLCLRHRPMFGRVFLKAAVVALSNTPVQEHEPVLPGSSSCTLTYTHLQANGFLTMVPLQSGLFQVVMSPATLDVYLRSCSGELSFPPMKCWRYVGIRWQCIRESS